LAVSLLTHLRLGILITEKPVFMQVQMKYKEI
jgi:hypothetical protein